MLLARNSSTYFCFFIFNKLFFPSLESREGWLKMARVSESWVITAGDDAKGKQNLAQSHSLFIQSNSHPLHIEKLWNLVGPFFLS